MLILSNNLYSLLFLLKNDIIFIACSNRVKQRCNKKFKKTACKFFLMNLKNFFFRQTITEFVEIL